jgi:hypothetical protein
MTKEKNSASRRIARMRVMLLSLLVTIVVVAGVLYYKSEQIILGAEGYIFGYPLVITDVSRVNAMLTLGPENQLYRVRRFPDASFKGVVRPNVDTLYTNAFIDMDQGPWVFEMAKNDQRYELMPFMDAWTNVFAVPGTRSQGKAGGKFLLAGPGWQGRVPNGLKLLRSPTRIVWLIGRTQTNGISDYATVHRLQDGVKLRKLTDWQSRPGAQEDPPVDWHPTAVPTLPPVVQISSMTAEAFFTRLAMLMASNPPAVADGPMMVKLSRIGITPGQPPAWSLLDRWSVSLGRWIADWTVARELKKPRDLVRGWVTPPAMIGNYGTFYNLRAVVAMVGLGANLPADAIYPSTRVDATGQALNGRHRYRLHFNPGELPPVNAFWSITAYGQDDFLIDNPIKRYALGDRDPLIFNSDGSLDLFVQVKPPEGDKKSNWLPVKSGEPFLLNARLYWPKPQALSGSWGMPVVERLD